MFLVGEVFIFDESFLHRFDHQECERPRCAAAQQLETPRFFGGIQGWMSIQMRVILKDRNDANLSVYSNELAIFLFY